MQLHTYRVDVAVTSALNYWQCVMLRMPFCLVFASHHDLMYTVAHGTSGGQHCNDSAKCSGALRSCAAKHGYQMLCCFEVTVALHKSVMDHSVCVLLSSQEQSIQSY